MPKIRSLKALEILDSRGRPTVKAYIELEKGIVAAASVPSGASTGKSEALELRDGQPRYFGMGCQRAVDNINNLISQKLSGIDFSSQEAIDQHLIQLDKSPNKSNLGANAILAVSMAFAKANAKSRNQSLYSYFSALNGTNAEFLPRPTINLFSGGKHAGGQVPIQDLLIVPKQSSVSKVLECAHHVFQAAVKLCLHKYGMRALTADEGGLAPPFSSIDDMFEDALQAIEQAGYRAGQEVMLAIDAASSQFYQEQKYYLGKQGHSSTEMIGVLAGWISKYPIISLEDGLAEDDWHYWPDLCKRIGKHCLVMGDDLLCTNPERIEKAVKTKSANALLLKVNQIGTITEALRALHMARNAGWQVTVSARSGETEDHWLADLAVGWQGDYIKIGSITQSERLSKYNRLLEIEQETGLSVSQ